MICQLSPESQCRGQSALPWVEFLQGVRFLLVTARAPLKSLVRRAFSHFHEGETNPSRVSAVDTCFLTAHVNVFRKCTLGNDGQSGAFEGLGSLVGGVEPTCQGLPLGCPSPGWEMVPCPVAQLVDERRGIMPLAMEESASPSLRVPGSDFFSTQCPGRPLATDLTPLMEPPQPVRSGVL